jgi:molybdopterin converting factor small subunit
MQVRVKLMGALRSKLPPGTQGGVAAMEVEPGTTVADILGRLGLAGGQVHLVLINGGMETDRQRPLSEADELKVFPPVAGGCLP